MEFITEHGFASTGLDAVLKRAMVPKGSFYHYFSSKAEFGAAVLDAYDAYFCRKLDRALGNEALPPLGRLQAFVDDAKRGMAKHQYARGCLVGNLSQELGVLPHDYRERLERVLRGWQARVAQCLNSAQRDGEISRKADCAALSEFFWIGWEGAVMRARLARDHRPLDTFIRGFLAGLPR